VRGALVFRFVADLYRLDSRAMAEGVPSLGLAPAYDEDFKEAILVDGNGDGVGEPLRREYPPVRVPCQVEPVALDSMRMTTAGNAPDSRLDLVFHFRDLERLGLVDPATGEALVRPSDRLGAIYDVEGNLVQAVRTPPGLYVTEARPIGFGLARRRPRRNLLLVRFEERRASREVA